jgi:hypothetical protein
MQANNIHKSEPPPRSTNGHPFRAAPLTPLSKDVVKIDGRKREQTKDVSIYQLLHVPQRHPQQSGPVTLTPRLQ